MPVLTSGAERAVTAEVSRVRLVVGRASLSDIGTSDGRRGVLFRAERQPDRRWMLSHCTSPRHPSGAERAGAQ